MHPHRDPWLRVHELLLRTRTKGRGTPTATTLSVCPGAGVVVENVNLSSSPDCTTNCRYNLLTHSVPQFHRLQCEDNHSIYLVRRWGRSVSCLFKDRKAREVARALSQRGPAAVTAPGFVQAGCLDTGGGSGGRARGGDLRGTARPGMTAPRPWPRGGSPGWPGP